jgi:hypothetical protein
MKTIKKILALIMLMISSFTYAKTSDTSKINTSEKINVEFACNLTGNSSLSISVEKEFTHNKWKFGPRVEFVNLLNTQQYTAEKMKYEMIAQLRVRLLQLEYQASDRIRIGVVPIWMLGPIPKSGFYRTPSSAYIHIQLKEDFSLETSFSNVDKEVIALSFRKVI